MVRRLIIIGTRTQVCLCCGKHLKRTLKTYQDISYSFPGVEALRTNDVCTHIDLIFLVVEDADLGSDKKEDYPGGPMEDTQSRPRIDFFSFAASVLVCGCERLLLEPGLTSRKSEHV
jgi:hypothetical protein